MDFTPSGGHVQVLRAQELGVEQLGLVAAGAVGHRPNWPFIGGNLLVIPRRSDRLPPIRGMGKQRLGHKYPPRACTVIRVGSLPRSR